MMRNIRSVFILVLCILIVLSDRSSAVPLGEFPSNIAPRGSKALLSCFWVWDGFPDTIQDCSETPEAMAFKRLMEETGHQVMSIASPTGDESLDPDKWVNAITSFLGAVLLWKVDILYLKSHGNSSSFTLIPGEDLVNAGIMGEEAANDLIREVHRRLGTSHLPNWIEAELDLPWNHYLYYGFNQNSNRLSLVLSKEFFIHLRNRDAGFAPLISFLFSCQGLLPNPGTSQRFPGRFLNESPVVGFDSCSNAIIGRGGFKVLFDSLRGILIPEGPRELVGALHYSRYISRILLEASDIPPEEHEESLLKFYIFGEPFSSDSEDLALGPNYTFSPSPVRTEKECVDLRTMEGVVHFDTTMNSYDREKTRVSVRGNAVLLPGEEGVYWEDSSTLHIRVKRRSLNFAFITTFVIEEAYSRGTSQHYSFENWLNGNTVESLVGSKNNHLNNTIHDAFEFVKRCDRSRPRTPDGDEPLDPSPDPTEETGGTTQPPTQPGDDGGTTPPPPPSACGNREIDPGEECDTVGGEGAGCGAGEICEACSCVSSCGDGLVQSWEQCDGGAADLISPTACQDSEGNAGECRNCRCFHIELSS